MTRRLRLLAPIALIALLTACATQSDAAVSTARDTPGFLLGVWHGFIFPVAWLFSLFDQRFAIYAVPNNGGWYDFGYFVGIVFLGVGARKTRIKYRERIITVRDAKVQE